MSSQQRKEFEAAVWVLGADGMQENPKADPNCTRCAGHGLLDGGNNYGCILVLCDQCWMPKEDTKHGS